MRRSNRAEAWLPLVYFAVALLLVVSVLPSVLRQAPPESNQTAELSPDAPPDPDHQSIIASLNRATSATAGGVDGVAAQTGVDAGAGPGLVAPKLVPRACPAGFGSPARQTESPYSPPCAVAWEGDNGGATAKGVTATEVRVDIWHGTSKASYDGPVPTKAPAGNESAVDRTYRVLQDYFNRSFQFYGRSLRLYTQTVGTSADNERTAAVKADSEFHVFAGVPGGQVAYCLEMAKRQLVTSCNFAPEQFFRDHAPYIWSWYMDQTKLMRFTAEYLCTKLANQPAAYAGEPVTQSKPRVFGLVYSTSPPEWAKNGDDLQRFMQQRCGVKFGAAVGIDTGSNAANTAGGAIVRMRAAGVTTIVPLTDFISGIALSQEAAGQSWFPEWFVASFGHNMRNDQGQLRNQAEWAHAFGFSGEEMALPLNDTDCFRAFHSIDPEHDPDKTICEIIFHGLLNVVAGIQMAGPRLTPKTFEQGLFRMGYRFYTNPVWAVGGGFGPGDDTYWDDIAEIWWDPTATDPADGQHPGAYRYQLGGRRFREGQLTPSDDGLFKDGVTTA